MASLFYICIRNAKIDHLQMKSFDTSAQLNWTQNEFGIALEPDSSVPGASAVQFTYLDMLRHQPVQAQVQVKNADSSKIYSSSFNFTLLS